MTRSKSSLAALFLPGALLRRGVAAWLCACAVEYICLSPEQKDLSLLSGLAAMSPLRLALVAVGIFAVFCAVAPFANTAAAERWTAAAAWLATAAFALAHNFTWGFFGACLLTLAVLTVYALFGRKTGTAALRPGKQRRVFGWLTAALALGTFLFLCAWGVGRVASFSTPTFDLGIFSQMFYNMDQTGLPLTTVERDGLLSHFAVHVSPIYYLMLPAYKLFPHPATLQILQAAVMVSAIVPLWKLAGHRGLSGAQKMLLCAALLLLPAFCGGAGYDLHENCFLTPLILWLFYGLERRSPAMIWISALLTLCVKEDAPVYVAVVGLWHTVESLLDFDRKRLFSLLTGIALAAVSLGWFAAVTGYLSAAGDGVMTYRYGNFMYDGSASLTAVVKAVILCPAKALFECVDAEKLKYVALTLVPLLGLPFLTRRYERLILLIPYILVNLMSDYRYQHDLLFQYSFGSTAFLVYLSLLNLSDIRFGRVRFGLAFLAAAAAATGFGTAIAPGALRYPKSAIEYREHYRTVREALYAIPESASVAATTFFTTELSGRRVLYDVQYCSREHLLSADYAVLSLSPSQNYEKYASGGRDGLTSLVALLAENGFAPVDGVDGTLVVYKKQ